MKFFVVLTLLLFSLLSCSSENTALSPLQNSVNSAGSSPEVKNPAQNFQKKSGKIFYASELSSQMSTIPQFNNSALNQEVNNLKFHVKEYVYAVGSYNLVGQNRALAEVEKSYKKIQKLRRFLNPSDNEVINRYLVRIKSNISQLEELSKNDRKQ